MSRATSTATYRPSLPSPRRQPHAATVLAGARAPRSCASSPSTAGNSGIPRTTPVVPVARRQQSGSVSPFGEVDVGTQRSRHAVVSSCAAATSTIAYAARELEADEAVPALLRSYLSMPSERFVRRHFDVTADVDRRTRSPPRPTATRSSSSPRSDEAQHQPHQLLVARRPGPARHPPGRPRPRVDDAGIDTLWVADHLLQMDPTASIDEPMLEAYSTLAFIAAATRTSSWGPWSPGPRSARRRCSSRPSPPSTCSRAAGPGSASAPATAATRPP